MTTHLLHRIPRAVKTQTEQSRDRRVKMLEMQAEAIRRQLGSVAAQEADARTLLAELRQEASDLTQELADVERWIREVADDRS